ncbi:SDR family oxidoreductase [Niastella yeongjuensis]|uniref:SDR family oxidoreductase n=2 Tax=Niastella yeongjuensis TaxID=354355 RepID=A0A1V9ET64_9BACT|nr:SDR family oxidoreductase [Niastella yeongjuensis]SEP10474.1 hypothetical protein SAMN05660816_04394 [Niastella yeongjuensis]
MKEGKNVGTAVVTGASSGLGEVFAARLAERGYDLQLIARRGDRLESLAAKIRNQFGVNVTTIIADLASAAELESVANRLVNDLDITLLINNAGTSTMNRFTDTPAEKQLAMIDVNIVALTVLSNAVLPGFKSRNKGTLINIASVLGYHTLPISAIYSGTKAFVVQFTNGLQQEFKDTNVTIQLALPASTATEIWEVGGVPISSLNPESVMTIENCVDAILAGLDLKESVTWPSVEDKRLYEVYEDARLKLFSATQTKKPASRYGVPVTTE